ncbi:hypothetical protein EST92_19785 [Streptomyces sp. TM32]|uniref:hypothetical protein n=1 Tax=Streptomyces sp. TM32 TaxID=1652669 RepID=UPI001011F358|nr:hypothetical protein [Streptomyces sp. TM32]RXS78876.1 hypothetical protein EST92_19785 [Streptomyces sp. TM32]
MAVTINAHQLGLLIDKTIGHIGGEYTVPLNGIRLDVDAAFLYAVASDRYTLAVARYRLLHDDQNGQPFARLIPAEYLQSLREWISSQAGSTYISISAEDHYLEFGGTHTELRIGVNPDLEYPDWRGLLRTMTQRDTEDAPFPALSADFMSRWAATGDNLRVRVTADQKAVLVFGEDFIGAQMPVRYAGVGPMKDETFDAVRQQWEQTLAAGADGLDMATDMPAEDDWPRYEVTKDVYETGGDLLQQVLRSNVDLHNAGGTSSPEFLAHATAGVHAWMAYRFLDALHTADPRFARTIVAEVAEQLDSGEIGEWAWDAAKEAGHNPQQWHDEYEAHLNKRAAEKAVAAEAAA